MNAQKTQKKEILSKEEKLCPEDKIEILFALLGRKGNLGQNQVLVLRYLAKKNDGIKSTELSKEAEKINAEVRRVSSFLSNVFKPTSFDGNKLEAVLLKFVAKNIADMEKQGLVNIYKLKDINKLIEEIEYG